MTNKEDMSLTDEQCNEFIRHNETFHEMIRSVYDAGAKSTGKLYAESDMIDFCDTVLSDVDMGANKTSFEWWRKMREACHDREY